MIDTTFCDHLLILRTQIFWTENGTKLVSERQKLRTDGYSEHVLFKYRLKMSLMMVNAAIKYPLTHSVYPIELFP